MAKAVVTSAAVALVIAGGVIVGAAGQAPRVPATPAPSKPAATPVRQAVHRDTLPGADVAAAFAASRIAKGFVPPKTPWGDPDLQGNFTHKDEANTPLERPGTFAGKTMNDITPEQQAAANAEAVQRAIDNLTFTGNSHEEGIAIGVPIHFFDSPDSVGKRPWLIIDPADGKIPPVTPDAQRRAQAQQRERASRPVNDSYLDRSIGDRCLVNKGVPTAALPGGYGNSMQIVQAKGTVVMRIEMIHESRVIPLDGRPLSGLRSYLGESRGHFEGNTLVVVTTNFNDQVNYRGSSEKLRVIERFTRTAKDKVEWTVTLDDSTTWTRPWTFTVPITEDDSQMIYEYACHEGNRALRNILTARMSEDARGITQKTGAAADEDRAEEK